MTLNQLREAMNNEPFQPFVIHLAAGRSISVVRREYIMRSPAGRTTAVYQPDGVLTIVDLPLVNKLETRPPGGSKQRRKR